MSVPGLEGRRVGVTNGYTYGDAVEDDRLIDKDAALRDELTLRKLVAGRVDFALVYTAVTDYLLQAHPGEFAGRIRQVGVVQSFPLYVSFSQKNPDAARAMALYDRGMKLIREDGTYARIQKRWSLPSTAGTP